MRQNSAKSQLRKRSCAIGVLDLGFPSVEEVSYMRLKGQNKDAHKDCTKEGAKDVLTSKAYLELQRKVAKLEATKKKQAKEIKQLQRQVAAEKGTGQCCCNELRLI